MTQPLSCFNSVASVLADQTKTYLHDQVGIDVTEVRATTENIENLKLRPLTAVLGVGGSAGLLVAFSFSQQIANALFERLTAGIEITPDQVADYREATLAEFANIVLGHCTGELAKDGEHISLSPPVVLEDAKSIFRMKNAMFGTISMATPNGPFDIHMVGPRDVFDGELNYRSGM